MRLYRTIASAHGGRVFANMGAAFNLSDELAAQVVRYFVPPIIKGIEKRTQSSRGLLRFLEFLGSHNLARHWDNADIFTRPDAEKDGQAALVLLFPQIVQVRRIVANRAKVLPVDPYVLEAMFPYVAVLALAAIELRTHQPLVDILQSLGVQNVKDLMFVNPYEGLANEIRRRHAVEARGKQRSGLAGIFGSLFTRSGTDNRSVA